eukprot:jgi/Bigna1/128717/aug1.7_g3425
MTSGSPLRFHDVEFFVNKKAESGEDQDGHEHEITPERLRELLDCKELKDVTSARLNLSARTQSLDSIGEILPNLTELDLSGSEIATLRDLGQSMCCNLRVLWLAHCNLKDLDCVDTMEQLEELYIPFNQIKDVSQLFLHPTLQVLDLDDNQVANVESVDFLASIKKLQDHASGNAGQRMRVYVYIKVSDMERKRVTDEDEAIEDYARREAAEQSEKMRKGIFPGHEVPLTKQQPFSSSSVSSVATTPRTPRTARFFPEFPNTSRSTSLPHYSSFSGSTPRLFDSPSSSARGGTASPLTFSPSRPSTAHRSAPETPTAAGASMMKGNMAGSELTFGTQQAIRGSFINSLRERRRTNSASQRRRSSSRGNNSGR